MRCMLKVQTSRVTAMGKPVGRQVLTFAAVPKFRRNFVPQKGVLKIEQSVQGGKALLIPV